jgi:hypothetical protein
MGKIQTKSLVILFGCLFYNLFLICIRGLPLIHFPVAKITFNNVFSRTNKYQQYKNMKNLH